MNAKVFNVNSLSTADKQALKGAVQEVNDSLTRVASEKTLQKEILDGISDKLGLDKKLVRRLASTYFKSSFKSEVEEHEAFEDFYNVLFSTDPTVAS